MNRNVTPFRPPSSPFNPSSLIPFPPMTNAEIAAVLDQIADLLEFEAANPFRVRAYRNGARAIHDLAEPAENRLDAADRPLTDVPGIGKDLAEKVAMLMRTGSLPLLDEFRSRTPESVLAILRIPGLGPKRAAALFHELGVSTLDELRTACESHQVRELKGFGEKTETAILAGMDIAVAAEERMRLGRRRPDCRVAAAAFRGLPGGREDGHRRELSPRQGQRRRPGPSGGRHRRRRGHGPLRRARRRGRRARRAATPRCPSGCKASSRWTSGSWRTRSSARPSSISPGRRPTTWSSAGWPRPGA